MFELLIIDSRSAFSRSLAASATQEAMNSGIVEACPSSPKLEAIIMEDGRPIARTAGSAYALGDRRATELRALTVDEESLPHCDLDAGYSFFAGGDVTLPDGRRLAIGHDIRIES